MTAPIDYLMEAKAARDQVRAELMKAVRRCPNPWSAEIAALIKADDAATEGLATALKAFDTISPLVPDAPRETPPAGDLGAQLAAVEGRFS